MRSRTKRTSDTLPAVNESERLSPAAQLKEARFDATPSVFEPDDARELEADRIAETVVRGGPVARSSGESLSKPLNGGTVLPTTVRTFFEPRFGRDLGGVRVHDDEPAHVRARAFDARAFTYGSDIFFGAREYDPESPTGQTLLAHELAHVLQPTPPGLIARRKLGDIQPAVRKKLRFSNSSPIEAEVQKWVKEFFGGEAKIPPAPAAAMEFDDAVPVALRPGLGGIADQLVGLSEPRDIPADKDQPAERIHTDPDKWPLPSDTVLDLVIDLSLHGGEHAIFRFTRYREGKTERILVEKTATIALPSTASMAAPATGASAAPTSTSSSTTTVAPSSLTGEISVGKIKVTVDRSFSEAKAKTIVETLQRIPELIQPKLEGMEFVSRGPGMGSSGRVAEYDGNKDVMNVWDVTFEENTIRYGTGTRASKSLLHELGHAIDQRPVMANQISRQRAAARRQELRTQLDPRGPVKIDPNAPIGGQSEETSTERERKQKINDEITKIDREIRKLDDASRTTVKSIAGYELSESEDTANLLSDFAKALKRDGITAVRGGQKKRREARDKKVPILSQPPSLSGNITRYANADLMEAFAESFALYILDEPLLTALRPATAAYIKSKLPKTAPPPAAKRAPRR